jgi:hypothetical protein
MGAASEELRLENQSLADPADSGSTSYVAPVPRMHACTPTDKEAIMINRTRLSDPMRTLIVTAAAIVVASFAPVIASAASAGDTFVFRVSNGYNSEARGRIQDRIDQINADRITVSTSTDIPALGLQQTAIYTKEGNWLRHTLTNHDQTVEYEFSPPYPAYVFPLDTGKSWSQRVTATNPVTGQRNSVRVDGEVLGSERISTPAGAFDTIKVRRRVYAGDFESFRRETTIVETDWYAPALGHTVKSDRKSVWDDMARCTRSGCGFRGDWNIFELVEVRSSKQ